jgi:Beta-propeller repeat
MSTKSLSQTMWKLAVGLSLTTSTATPAQSAEAWVQRYGHSPNLSDVGTRLVIDKAGNVIVTGPSESVLAYPDYATIKYSGAGVPSWTNRYNAPANTANYPTGLAVDGDGSVIVTGYADFADYNTIKYSSAGVPLWTNRYNGTYTTLDEAHALAVDSDDNVVVTGNSDSDYATIKYSGAGVPLWTNRYDEGRFEEALAIAVDRDGNVVVTGESFITGGTIIDYATIKYSGAGVPLWTNISSAGGNAVAVDGSGNVIVTGGSATIKYSGAGVPLWTNTSSAGGRAVAVDGDGNVIVTGGSATIKYSGAGALLWSRGAGASVYSLAVDGGGNVVVTGESDNDVVTIRYSSAGIPLWTNRYNGPGNGLDTGYAVAVDGSGNVFVTGRSFGGSSSNDFVTIKYSVAALAPIQLNHQIVGNVIKLSWTNSAFSLQAAPDAQGSYTNIIGATSPYSTSLSGARRYFRLAAN